MIAYTYAACYTKDSLFLIFERYEMAGQMSRIIEKGKVDSMIERFPLPGNVQLSQVLEIIGDAGAVPYLVGGCVRDLIMDRGPQDLDIEVFGISPQVLERILRSFVPINIVGRAFSVYKITGTDIEFSLPRKDSKTGLGHRGFEVTCEPDLSFSEAARRRDFTMNAMGICLNDYEMIDPWNGIGSIEEKILDIVDTATFVEDPLRVLRACQFLSRFAFSPSDTLITCSRRMRMEDLPRERIFHELEKTLLGSEPSRGVEFLMMSGWIRYFPELAALVGVPQDHHWHPEGDVWKHTLASLDEAVHLRYGCGEKDVLLMFGVLCHDFGKISTTVIREGRFRSIGHSRAGVSIAEKFMKRLTDDKTLITGVKKLVSEHLAPQFLFRQNSGPSAIRRLSRRLSPELNIDLLERCARADYRASGNGLKGDFNAGKWLLEQADALRVRQKPEEQVLMGRHLIEAGLTPGPQFGAILKRAYEIQLDEGEHDIDALRERVLMEYGEGLSNDEARQP